MLDCFKIRPVCRIYPLCTGDSGSWAWPPRGRTLLHLVGQPEAEPAGGGVKGVEESGEKGRGERERKNPKTGGEKKLLLAWVQRGKGKCPGRKGWGSG